MGCWCNNMPFQCEWVNFEAKYAKIKLVAWKQTATKVSTKLELMKTCIERMKKPNKNLFWIKTLCRAAVEGMFMHAGFANWRVLKATMGYQTQSMFHQLATNSDSKLRSYPSLT